MTAYSKSKTKRKKKWLSYKLMLMVLPCVAIVFVFRYLPLWGWSFAFVEYKPGRALLDCDFVGWKHFTRLFVNPVMRRDVVRVLINTFGIQFLYYLFTPLPMIFAVLLSEVHSKKFQKMVQTLTTLPHFVSWVIMSSLMLSMFGNNGVVNNLLGQLGIEEKINILTTDKNVWLIQALLRQWKELGWNAIIYFAAIAGIDQEMYEAAMVDGAGRWAKMRYITFPMLIPTYFVLLIMSIGNFLNAGLDQYMVFSNALNKEYIEVLDLYVYNLGIGSGKISMGVAVGMMKSLVALVLFGAANYSSKKIRGTSVF